MFRKLIDVFKLPDLRRKILITLGILVLVRLIAQIPLPGIDRESLKNFFSQNQALGILDIFSGGALSNFSVGFMGVGPYITASIIFQMLTYIVPSLDELQKEGEQGRAKLNQYTRMLTIPLAIIQAFSLISILKNQGLMTSISAPELLTMLFVSCAATVILMWLGENISESGIGNGISMIIAVGIIAAIPVQIRNTAAIIAGGGIIDSTKIWGLVGFLLISLLTIGFIVFINDASRKIPISYARRIVGRRSYGGVDTYLPIKLNTAGVIPIIFALSIIAFPGLVGNLLANAKSQAIANFGTWLNNIFNSQNAWYGIIYFVLVVIFTFFYTSIVFKPKNVAENLQKQGGFIPGIRPGPETETFVRNVVMRVTLPGAIFLGIVAILPFVVQSITRISTLVLGGTSVLIMVSVIIETASQIKAHLISRQYEIY